VVKEQGGSGKAVVIADEVSERRGEDIVVHLRQDK
jgi:hypothetical protein